MISRGCKPTARKKKENRFGAISFAQHEKIVTKQYNEM